jgi:hypothetical protein
MNILYIQLCIQIKDNLFDNKLLIEIKTKIKQKVLKVFGNVKSTESYDVMTIIKK